MTREELAQKIKATRKELGISQSKCAEYLGISKRKLAGIESGVEMIGINTLEKFVDLCGVELEDFLKEK